jgi:gluconolactonase
MRLEVDLDGAEFREIVTGPTELEVIAEGMIFGEGPVWNAAEGALYWSDILGNAAWRWTPHGGAEVAMQPTGKANGMTYDHQHRRVVAGWASRSIWRVEGDGSITTLADSYDGTKINSPNDIVVRSDGSIFWTDSSGANFIPGMDGPDVQRRLDFDGVFQLLPDERTVRLATDALTYPNGLAFSPDERYLYVTDTTHRNVRRFEVAADGSLSGDQVFYSLVGDEPGVADGMKVDSAGHLYVTGSGGIHVLDTSGRLLGRIRIPGIHTSNMAWGDDDWRSLYITTHHVVYRIRVGIPGVPVAPTTEGR